MLVAKLKQMSPERAMVSFGRYQGLGVDRREYRRGLGGLLLLNAMGQSRI